ncbi:uncharacterized protein LOC130789017 [Actinidia eriantha]|uniref:uncharacterized protein LOC130789017 n=1 Tax=Actinidia eriantha TaxID=165200 RepID=UPI00258E6EBE|nr:uncharacterized protein LOC130789017 [Actinidia eriantha]
MEKVKSEVWFDDGDEDGYDAIVVGSGYGGSVAACRMSVAGIKVCLVEKGQRWESKDFPTDSLKIMSAVRIENRNLGISFGPKDALFQVYEQDDSLAAVACGLGGGSLVNAGVMLPTPIRARRNPKWPKEWERDWEICEASASAMLRMQSAPTKFPNAKVMEEMVGEEFEESCQGPVNLSVNFDIEEQPSSSVKSHGMGNCLGCGNCLTGCPYNAKNSTDKTYLVSAIQAGCTVKTECQVQYVVENLDYTCQKEKRSGRKRRRWLVYFNEIDYVTADFVILSAGVFGTAGILFQSQLRGLKLSERLGSGFSCNGNTVAYLAGSPAPLNAYGLDKNTFSKTPFEERPGPSISSSYTSSLGFTIQSAVLPVAYPYLLFKGITTYGWPPGFWFLHGVIDKMKHMLGARASNAMILNAMGFDESDGKITFEKDANTICFRPPHDRLLPRKLEAFQKLTKKLGGILFMSRYRSTSVHLLGGCNASPDPSCGVCNPKGQVFDGNSQSTVYQGLYVCDASLVPCCIGINPCLTITALAEHVSRHLVKDILMHKAKEGTISMDKFVDQWPGSITSMKLDSSLKSMVVFKETMRGYVGGMPCTAYLKSQMNSKTSKNLDGKSSLLGVSHPLLRGKVGGYVVFRALEVDKLHVIDGEVDLCEVDERTPYTQYMHYRLLLAASSGSRYVLEGKKVMNPYLFALYAWRETTTIHVTLKKVVMESSKEEVVSLKGKLSISMVELLKCLRSLEGNLRGRFICLLVQTFFRTYISQVPRGSQKDFHQSNFCQNPYPSGNLHRIQTDDGFIISCIQWKSNDKLWRLGGEKKLNPVLLINGHSTESYWLPTEPNDLVRTLLDEGHETWLLQARLHPLNSSNNFTIEDIGRFDIPAVINMIRNLHGPLVKVHVVAHCVGGLAIHIAIMGGHVSAAYIASLSCTNSSMFFKLTASSRFKMWLPLIPLSMVILGKNKILPLLKPSNTSSRHRLLKCIARLVPRYERCTCDECEIFSGIFGNTFWHNNISSTMHYWLNKLNLPWLPMAAFPHLRKICNTGFIVNPNGESSYLIHPERMALPTLYISGGRTLLVTPQTSFLANNYMKLHQPVFRHERVVVEGFGHSDLLIGEESYIRVFPHILSHIRLAEEGKKCVMGSERSKNNKEALAWGDDPFVEANGGFWSWISPLVTMWLLSLFLVMMVYVLL